MHARPFILFSFLFIALVTSAQQGKQVHAPAIQHYFYKLGNTKITIRKTTYRGAGTPLFVQLHDDENTAETATLTFLKKHGGTLISIENAGKRYISFTIKDRRHLFDPNRMFTAKGIRENLKFFDSYSPAAAAAVEKFRVYFVQLMQHAPRVIAVHNNTNGRYSVQHYKKNNVLSKDAARVHINQDRDSDDFFITTRHEVFKKLLHAGYNCVLQSNRHMRDDGSLSYYFGKRNHRYINVEAQKGHFSEQLQMLRLLQAIL